jgi:outer membrane biosynthesis protein TonB
MTTLRTCLAISVAIHVVIMLWLALGPGAHTLGPASAEPIMVDLVAPQDAPKTEEQKSEEQKSEEQKSETQEAKAVQPKADEPKAEEPKTEKPKSEPIKSERPAPRKPEPPKPDSPKTGLDANQQPPPKNDSKSDSRAAAQDSAEERAATAARLAWMLNLPTDTSTSLAAPPSEDKSNLAREEIAEFKAQVSKCWVAPADAPGTSGFDVLIRIALNPDGRLATKPELIRAPGTDAGALVVNTAKQALLQCQPYGTLPAGKYKDWKILDLTFTAQGPSGLSGPSAGKSAVKR